MTSEPKTPEQIEAQQKLLNAVEWSAKWAASEFYGSITIDLDVFFRELHQYGFKVVPIEDDH